MKETFKIDHFDTFREETPEELLNKDWYFVEEGTAAGQIRLVTAAAVADPNLIVGVVFEYDPHTTRDHNNVASALDVNVLLTGAVGKVKAKTSGAISYGSSVKIVAGGTIVAAGADEEAVGRYRGPDAANGDIIEIYLGRHTAA